MYDVSREDVLGVLRSGAVGTSTRSKYFVETDGKKYPAKKVVARALSIPVISFTTGEAYRLLDRLGFRVLVLEGNNSY